MNDYEVPNIDYIDELASGDLKFKNTLLQIVKSEFPLEQEEFLQNFKAKAYDEAALNVHKLKHKINVFGLKKGYNVAVNFENELKQGNFKEYSQFMDVLKTIEAYLKTL